MKFIFLAEYFDFRSVGGVKACGVQKIQTSKSFFVRRKYKKKYLSQRFLCESQQSNKWYRKLNTIIYTDMQI